MAKSSCAVALLLAGWSADAAAQAPDAPLTVEAAMSRYRQWLDGSSQAHCAQPGNAPDQEIVVCGRTHQQPERSPLPVSRDPGEIVRHAGEAGGGGAACYASCEQPLKLDLIGAARAVPKIINHILGKDD
jgi:hypothetical protein